MVMERNTNPNRAANAPIAMHQPGARPDAVRVWPASHAGSACRPATRTPEPLTCTEAAPVWFAVLMASECRAVGSGEDRPIRWDYVSGRAFYTNRSAVAESIHPLGVELARGDTLAVSWAPGHTEYTIEVFTLDSEQVA